LNLPLDISNLYFDIQEQSVAWCESGILHFQNKYEEIRNLNISAIPSCNGIAISPDKHHVSVWRGDLLYLVNYDTGQVDNLILNEPRYRRVDIDSASFSPNEEFLVSIQGALVVWQVDSPQKLAMGHARGALGNVVKTIVSNDSSFVVTLNVGTVIESDRTSNLTVWRVEDGAESMRINPPLVKELQPKFETFALSPDDKLLVTGDDFGGVRIWSIESGDEAAYIEFDSTPLNFAFTRDGSGLLILLSDGTIRLWGIPQL
jgi:WD40 repeat protein